MCRSYFLNAKWLVNLHPYWHRWKDSFVLSNAFDTALQIKKIPNYKETWFLIGGTKVTGLHSLESKSHLLVNVKEIYRGDIIYVPVEAFWGKLVCIYRFSRIYARVNLMFIFFVCKPIQKKKVSYFVARFQKQKLRSKLQGGEIFIGAQWNFICNTQFLKSLWQQWANNVV